MDRIKEALNEAEEKLKKDATKCAAKCQAIGESISGAKDEIKQKEAYLAALVEDFNKEKSNYDSVQGQLKLLESLKTSIA